MFFHIIFILIIVILPVSADNIMNKAGSSFLDTFDRYNDKFWTHHSGLRITRTPVARIKFLQIYLRNNCVGIECCDQTVGDCTQYTGAQITSMAAFGYGSYRFFAVSGHTSPSIELEADDDAFSCCMLESSHYRDQHGMPIVGISICQAVSDPWRVIIVWKNEDEYFNKIFKLQFNSAKRMASYRIDWSPEKVKFYVSDRLLYVIREKDQRIPNRPLNVRAGLHPYVPIEQIAERISIPDYRVEIKMSLFRIQYQKLTLPPDVIDHTDLFVLGGDKSLLLKTISISVIILVNIFLVICFRLWLLSYEHASRLEGYIVL